MTGLTSSLVGLLLIAILMAPIVWAGIRSGSLALQFALIWTLLSSTAIVTAQSGVLGPRVPSWVTEDAIRVKPDYTEICRQLIPELRKYGVLVEDPRPGRLVVDEEKWTQIPANFQEILARCAPRDGAPAEVTFARRAG